MHNPASLDHRGYIFESCNIFQRVVVDRDQIGFLADLEGTELVCYAEELRADDRSGSESRPLASFRLRP